MNTDTPRGRGRPPVGPAIEVRLPADVLERLDEIAAEYGVKRAELVRSIVMDWMRF
jgi:metal-responsive CopG/Arc/MetJ family transcriptional regulator